MQTRFEPRRGEGRVDNGISLKKEISRFRRAEKGKVVRAFYIFEADMEFVRPPRLVSLELFRNRGDDEIVLGLVVDLLLECAEESSEVDASCS